MKALLILSTLILILTAHPKADRSGISAISTKKGSCQTVKRRFTGRHETVLTGVVMECETKEPIKFALLGIDKDPIFYTDGTGRPGSTGRFYKKLRPGRYSLGAVWISYLFETTKIHLKSNDSLAVIFYLKNDTTPLRYSQVNLKFRN